MRKSLLVLAASTALLVACAGSAAAAGDPATGGVTASDANAACAGVVGVPVPDASKIAAYVAAYNTTDNTDDGPAATLLGSPAYANLIYQQELHRDYLGLNDLVDSATFTCNGAVAVFPDLALVPAITDAVCANARLDLITNVDLRARVQAALKVLDRSYRAARTDCAPPVTTTVTAPPTTSPAPVPPTTPAPVPADYTQVDAVPVGGVETGA